MLYSRGPNGSHPSPRGFAGRLRLFAKALALGFLLLAFANGAQAEKKEKGVATVKEQLKFGVKMAQRGLWREALFRFRQAQRLDPQNPQVLNNMAVAHEALGLFEEALVYYRQALELDSDNRTLRRNYARFVEFYQAYKPPEPAEPSEEEGLAKEDPAQPGEGGEESPPTGEPDGEGVG